MKTISPWKAYSIWICAAFFYIYQFILRVSPSLMVDDLMLHFQTDASQVAGIAALAMYSYSLLQVPAGILVDTFGTRKVLLNSILLCILGVSLFSLSPFLLPAKLGRILLGAGSASAFICVCKISTQWFSPKQRARLLGLTMSMGTVGAYIGSVSLSHLIAKMGWKNTLLSTNLLGLVVLCVAFFTVPKSNPASQEELENSDTHSLREVIQQLIVVVQSSTFWIYSVTAIGLYLSISVIADLWGVPFVMQNYGVDKVVAANRVSLVYIGLCTGSIFLTTLSDMIGSKKNLIRLCILMLFILNCMVVYWASLPLSVLSILLFGVGFFGGGEMLCFASLCETSDSKITGTLTGLMNCVVMSGGAFIAEQVGRLLDYFWNGELHSTGIRLYSSESYQKSLSLIVFVIFASTIAAVFLSSKNRQLPEPS